MKRYIRILLEYLRGEPQHLNKLLKRGLVVGENFTRMGGVIIDPSHCYHIRIGSNVTLAPRVHILAHDASTYPFLGKTRAANVTIGDDVFIGAYSIVLPSVTIGNRVVIGAGSVVTKSIPGNSVAVGNPARVICSLDQYIEKEKAKIAKTLFRDSGMRTGLKSAKRLLKRLKSMERYLSVKDMRV